MGVVRMDIPTSANETYAFEQHYYELVNFSVPIHLIKYQLIKTMEGFGKPRFQIPPTHSKNGLPLWFVFKIEGENYYYQRVVCEDKTIRAYNDQLLYGMEHRQ